jgi:vacuolar protein sorting-associated protein 13A/C
VRTSAHQRQIHAKVHRIQIDNQLRACLFPVIMAPVKPPKSVVADSIPKPFIELSVLEYVSPEHNSVRQFKYICALVQELHIKVDQGLLNAYNDLFEEEEILDEDITEFLKEDLAIAGKPLKEIAKLQVRREPRVLQTAPPCRLMHEKDLDNTSD